MITRFHTIFLHPLNIAVCTIPSGCPNRAARYIFVLTWLRSRSCSTVAVCSLYITVASYKNKKVLWIVCFADKFLQPTCARWKVVVTRRTFVTLVAIKIGFAATLSIVITSYTVSSMCITVASYKDKNVCSICALQMNLFNLPVQDGKL